MAISHDATYIYVTGTETGDTVRSYIVTNSLGTVSNRSTVMGRTLQIGNATAGTFTDYSATWIFPSTYTFYVPRNSLGATCTTTLTDVEVIYDGSPKSYYTSFNRGTHNWTRVVVRDNVVGAGRTDFFTDQTYTPNWNDVSFTTSLGTTGADADIVHMGVDTNVTLNNFRLTRVSGSTIFEPGATSGATLTLNNPKLTGVSTIYSFQTGDSYLVMNNLTWDATLWEIYTGPSSRNTIITFVNPNHPSGWTGYTGQISTFKEQFTHDVTVTDGSSLVTGATVAMWYSPDTAYDYTATTSSGVIAKQYVDTYRGTTARTSARNLIVFKYGNTPSFGSRTFTSAIVDALLIPIDAKITQTTKATVDAYTTIDTLDKLYDRFSSWRADTTNIRFPSIGTSPFIASGDTIDLNAMNVVIDASAASAFSFNTGTNTLTIKATTLAVGSTFTKLKTTGTISFLNSATTTATLISAHVNLPATGTYTLSLDSTYVVFTVAGSYVMTGSTFFGTTNFSNTSGGAVTLTINSISYVNSGPSITVIAPTNTRGLQFTGLLAGSTVKVFDTGTQTEAFSTTSSSTTETWSETATGSRTVDYTVFKDGYIPIRVTSVVVTGAISGGVLTTPIQQLVDRAYVTSTGLTTSNATFNTTTKIFTLTANSTVQNWYSFFIEQFRSNASLKNIAFPLVTNGPNSFSLTLGWEFNSSTSISKLSRDGMRYVSTGGTQTAVWSAILTAGVPSGRQARYQQSDGGTTVNAQNTGDIDQLIQVYGDSTHGNFDKRSYLILKAQLDGYDEAVTDVYAQYGTLEDQLYVVGLTPLSNGLATGNPSVTGITITDHGASPVTWNGKVFSITITDSSTAHTGTQIMRWLRYNYELGGTFQGTNAFNWHDLVKTNGSSFKTVRGAVYGDIGAALKGVRVVQSDGTSAHIDFNLFTADDGTTYTPPQAASIVISGATAGSRIQLYDTTNSVELYNGVPSSFPYTYSETYASDKAIRLRVAYCTSSTANNFIDTAIGSITSTALNLSYLVSPVVNSVYVANAIDGTTITDCSISGTSLRVNISTGATSWQHIYAFMTYWLFTSGGIRDQYLEMTATDQTNYVFATAHGSFKIKNTSGGPLVITGGNAAPDSGPVTDILDTTGGTIFAVEKVVVPFTYSTGSGLSTDEHTQLFKALTTSKFIALK